VIVLTTILLRDLGTTLELREHIGVKKELTSKLYSHANLKKKKKEKKKPKADSAKTN
jgi:hypothetical protein